MGNRDAVAIRGARRDRPVRVVLKECRRHELQPGLVLRQIDDAPLAGARMPLESSEDRDDAVADGDVIDVRAVKDHRCPRGIAEELREAGERGELASVARVLRVRTGLALIARREDDEIRLRLPHRVDRQAAAREGARGERLDDDVRRRDEAQREIDRLGLLEIEGHAALARVVEGEHRRTIRSGLVVLERRIRRAERIKSRRRLEVDDVGSVRREVRPDERARRGPAELDDAHPIERSHAVTRPSTSRWCSPRRGGARRIRGRSPSKSANPPGNVRVAPSIATSCQNARDRSCSSV